MVILDTNLIIDHLRMRPEKSKFISVVSHKYNEVFSISILSIQELYAGKSTKKEKALKELLFVLAKLKVLPYTHDIAKLAGEIMRDSKNLIDFADAAIAATTIINEAELYTLNEKHFKGISNLSLLSF